MKIEAINKDANEKENKIINEIKNLLSSNIIFFIGILLLVYKAILLNVTLEIEIKWQTIKYIIFVALLLMCPIINNRKKFSYIYLNILYCVITIIIYGNFLYYGYSTNFLSFYQIENVKYAKEIGESLTCIVTLKNILVFWIDNIILLILSIICYKKLNEMSYKNKILKTILLLLIIFSNIIIVRKEINESYIDKVYNKMITVQDISIYYYHYEDAKEYITSQFVKEEIDYDRLEKIHNNISNKDMQTKYTGIAENSNVIILQLESINEYVIDKKINGKEITPNLNKFFKNNIYCSDMYNQGLGTTADSEFEMENSMYPLENGYIFQKYYGNNWKDIYSTLKKNGYYTSFMHPNTSTFWNREAVYNVGYNIDEYNDINKFPNIEKAGGFYSDEGFLEKAVDIMNSYDRKFCTTLVNVTTHIPFELDGVSNKEEKITITEEDVKDFEEWIYRNYLISCNFSDYAFGKYMDELERTGLLDNSIIIVYGDHGAGITCHKDIEKLYNMNGLEYTEFEKKTLDVHVPFGIKIPNVNENTVIKNTVSKIDIKPTILDLLGIKDDFSIGSSIFSNKDYSFIKGMGYITSKNYLIGNYYYDRITLQQVNETDELKKLLEKMKEEIYLSDTIIKNNLIK